MFRSVTLTCALALVACGKTVVVGGGIQLDVTYQLQGGTQGCIVVQAVPEGIPGTSTQASLTGQPRSGTVSFAINQELPDAQFWPRNLSVIASLHAATCDDPLVAQRTLAEMFPDGIVRIEPVTLIEPVSDGGATGGGAGGGGAGGGATGGGATGGGATGGGATGGGATGGGATGGGATGGGATGGGATGGGATGGGATGGGATGGGATGGGATGGGATGGGAASCDGGFVVFPEPIGGAVNDLSVFGPGSLWIVGAPPKLALRTPGVRDGGFIAGNCPMPASFDAVWAASDGHAYLGFGNVGTLYKTSGPDGGCAVATMDIDSSGSVTAITGTASKVFVGNTKGHVTRYDTVNDNATDDQPLVLVQDVVALSDTDVYAVGASGSGAKGGIAHFDGANWTLQYDGSGNTQFNAISFVNPNLAFAAGEIIARFDRDAGWSGGPGVPCVIQGIAATEGPELYVVCGDNFVYHYDNVGSFNGWSRVGSQTGSNFSRLRGSSRCDLWAVGSSGGLLTTNH